MSKKSQLVLILITAFLDILSFGILIPNLPDIILGFGMSESWTAYSQGFAAIGTFIWGLFFGKLSDIYGRKRMLVYTSGLNLLGFILLFCSLILTIGTSFSVAWISTLFLLFIVSRIIWGLGGAGFWVVQAYISDISAPSERTKNMGLIGAAFGFAFLVWPAIGWLLGQWGIEYVILWSIVAVGINFLMIIAYLPEPTKHITEMHTENVPFHFSREVIILFILSFGTTLAFSSIQSGSSQFYLDIFHFDSTMRGYTMSLVWVVSILYQWWLVRYVRAVFLEKQMIFLALWLMTIAFILFAYNRSTLFLFAILPLFPLAMGSFWPSISSLFAQKAGKDVGEVMGYNTSVTSIAMAVAPFLIGMLYEIDKPLPFLISGIIAFLLFILAFWGLRKKNI